MEKKKLYRVVAGIFHEKCYIAANSFAEAESAYKKTNSKAYNEGISEIECIGRVLIGVDINE
jgi:hypothetical protein